MALTFADIVISGSITLVDFGGQNAVLNVNLVETDPVQAQTDLETIANRIKAISGLQVDRIALNVAYTTVADDAVGVLNPAPSFGAEREHYSVFEVTLSDGRKASILVPGPIQAILNTANPDYIESANAAVQSFLDIYRTTGDNLATVGTESVVGDPSQAYTRHKESRTKVERRKLG